MKINNKVEETNESKSIMRKNKAKDLIELN
jgi:hypothetical protein